MWTALEIRIMQEEATRQLEQLRDALFSGTITPIYQLLRIEFDAADALEEVRRMTNDVRIHTKLAFDAIEFGAYMRFDAIRRDTASHAL